MAVGIRKYEEKPPHLRGHVVSRIRHWVVKREAMNELLVLFGYPQIPERKEMPPSFYKGK